MALKLNGGRAPPAAAVCSVLTGLAIRIDSEKHLAGFDWMSVRNANFLHDAIKLGFDFVHDFHRLDDAQDLPLGDTCADGHIRFGTWFRLSIESSNHP